MRKVKGLEEKLARLAQGEGAERAEEEEEEELPEGFLSGPLGEAMEGLNVGVGMGEEEGPDRDVYRRQKEEAAKSTLFKGGWVRWYGLGWGDVYVCVRLAGALILLACAQPHPNTTTQRNRAQVLPQPGGAGGVDALRRLLLRGPGRLGGRGLPLWGSGEGHHAPDRGPPRAGAWGWGRWLWFVACGLCVVVCSWMYAFSAPTNPTDHHHSTPPRPTPNSGSSAPAGSTCSRSGCWTQSTPACSCPSTSTGPGSPSRCVRCVCVFWGCIVGW